MRSVYQFFWNTVYIKYQNHEMQNNNENCRHAYRAPTWLSSIERWLVDPIWPLTRWSVRQKMSFQSRSVCARVYRGGAAVWEGRHGERTDGDAARPEAEGRQLASTCCYWRRDGLQPKSSHWGVGRRDGRTERSEQTTTEHRLECHLSQCRLDVPYTDQAHVTAWPDTTALQVRGIHSFTSDLSVDFSRVSYKPPPQASGHEQMRRQKDNVKINVRTRPCRSRDRLSTSVE